MGLFSALGFGGGKLDVQLKGKQVTAGGELQGRVIFKGGKREQDVKTITASVAQTTYKTEPGPNGPQRTSHSETIVQGTPIAGAFTIQPGASQEFNFVIPLPPDLYNSEADVEYRLSMSADIDGEVDPGDGEPFTVTGGKPFPKPVVPATPPAPTAGVPGGMPAPAPAGMPGPALAVGAHVLAQWTDGSWQQARVVSNSGNMIAVDWADPRFGASTWVQSQQVMAAAPPMPAPTPGQFPAQPPQTFPAQPIAGQSYAGQPVMGQPMPGPSFPGQPVMGQPMPGQPFPGQPVMGQPMPGQPFPGQPVMGQPVPGQPYPGQPVMGQPMPGQPYPGQPVMGQPMPGQPMPGQPVMGQPMMAMPVMPPPLGVGARVLAQWTDGNWYPAAVVQIQGNLVGVDWEDPRLGTSSWVQLSQVQQR